MSPPDGLPLELRLGLRAGSVFYFEARELRSTEPHYFVVVNRDPLGLKLLLLAVFTSNLEGVKLRNKERPSTVVEIAPADYPELTLPSAIDCNVLFRRTLDEMSGMVRSRVVRYHRDLPPAALARVREAILLSPVIEEEDKDLVR